MKNTKLTAAVLALIAAVVFIPSAKAAGTYSAGQLVLGMYDTTGDSPNSYEVDLGSFSSLSYGETWDLSSDISSVFTNTPSTADLVWAVAGTGGAVSTQSGLTKLQIVLSAPSTSTVNGSPTGNTTEESNINAQTNLLTSANALAGSSNNAYIIANTNGASFDSKVNANGGSYGLGTYVSGGLLTSYNNSNVADFYSISNGKPGVTTLEGQFSFNNGVLTYGAVPEPSTYALMGVGLLAFVWMLKRRASMTV